jgi:predicted small lipoprotein YifL
MLNACQEPAVNRAFRLSFIAAGGLAVALLLSGCGRRGGLDPPPGAAAAGPGQPAQQGSLEVDSTGRMIAPKGPRKHIPPDWLID